MKKILILSLIMLVSGAFADSAMENIVQIDLKNPRNSIRLNFLEGTDATVKAQIKRHASDYDVTDWTGLLWIGDSTGGVTVTNSTAYKGGMTWYVGDDSMPTNGRYTAIVLGVSGTTTEQWSRGVVSVADNMSLESLPPNWNPAGYIYDIATNALAIAEAQQAQVTANTADITAVSNQVVALDIRVSANSETGSINTANIASLSNTVAGITGVSTNMSISAVLISNHVYTITITD
jgi:hypothetical protein